jgi:hypothetical protein
MMPASNSVEGNVSAQADLDDVDEEELSPYPMFEGTFSELCVAYQNDNGDEGDDVGDEGVDDSDNNEDIC